MNPSYTRDTHLCDQADPQVCLLIDFENWVLGLQQAYGEDRLLDLIDAQLLFRIAEDYGRVVIANAYADWRSSTFNQFQIDLYKLGIDLIHVLARGKKNAVDVKMAVDAIETLWAFPHIKTFVIVSGDRDFIHVFKTLRRRGKHIIGVAPTETVNDDVATLCDRFVFYTALWHSYAQDNPQGTPSGHTVTSDTAQLGEVRNVLAKLLHESADTGLKGAQVIPLLRRELSPTFDVSQYGFTKLIQLLRACGDLLRIETSSGGDITLYPVTATPLPTTVPTGQSDSARLIQYYGLNDYRFEANRQRRHQLLMMLYNALAEQDVFVWRAISDRVVEETADSSVSTTLLSKYQAILWQARTFTVLPSQEGIPVKERRMKLAVADSAAFIDGYERSILYKLLERNANLTADEALLLLSYDMDDPTDSARFTRVWSAARQLYQDRFQHLGTVDPQRYAQSSEKNTRVLLQALERAFSGMESTLSRGRLTQCLKQAIANERIMLRPADVEAFLERCITLGLLLKKQDGVTSVYALAEQWRQRVA